MKPSIVYLTITLLSILLVPGINVLAQQNEGYEITGYLKGLKDGEKVVMRLSNSKGEGTFRHFLVDRDSTYASNGSFTLKGYVPDGPRRYELYFDKHYASAFLYINNGEKITIKGGDLDTLSRKYPYFQNFVTIEGSPTHTAYTVLDQVWRLYDQCIGRINREMRILKDSIGYDKALTDGLMDAKKMINTSFYYAALEPHIDSFLKRANTFLTLEFETSGHAAFWLDFYNSLSDQQKQSFNGKLIGELTKRCVGQVLPAFVLPDTTGKTIQLKDIVSKHKITIVHFWADKSIVREAYDQDLRAMYKLYHDKGLGIVGVSTESYTDEWKETLETEKYPWVNVLDLKGKQIVAAVYHELGNEGHQNTTNVLLDQSGKIIAWDPTGIELQWYIDHYVDDLSFHPKM